MSEPVSQKHSEYLDAKALADTGAPARVFLMAAMLADDEDAARLVTVFPALHAETMRRRWDSETGKLPGDKQDIEQDGPKLEALGRDD